MQRNLLIVGLLFISIVAFAQKKKTSSAVSRPDASKSLSISGTAFLYPVDNAMDVQFDYKQINAPLPQFNVINYQNKDITQSFFNGSNLFVIVFNPGCEHCEDETRLLMTNIALFKNSKVLMMAAPIMTPQLSYFESNVKFSQYPAFTVAIDSAKVLDKIFNYNNLPQINIYNGKDKRLLKTFNSDTPLDSLKQYIQ
jgi:hypothetical protein